MTTLADLSISIEWQPVDESIVSPELRATFARLEIWVGDDCITFVEDQATRSVRRSVAVPMYPLAEWIAFNWWRLQYDGRTPLDSTRLALASHSTFFAGDGFCWPDLRLSSEGELTRLRWERQPVRVGWPLRFLAQGVGLTTRGQAIAALEACVEAVLGRLAEAGLGDTVLSKEWNNLRSLDAEDAEYCRAVARLGLDPLAEGADLVSDIDSIWQIGGEALALELLDAASVSGLRDAGRWLTYRDHR